MYRKNVYEWKNWRNIRYFFPNTLFRLFNEKMSSKCFVKKKVQFTSDILLINYCVKYETRARFNSNTLVDSPVNNPKFSILHVFRINKIPNSNYTRRLNNLVNARLENQSGGFKLNLTLWLLSFGAANDSEY